VSRPHTGGDKYEQATAAIDQLVRQFTDALRRRDRAGTDAARANLRQTLARLRAAGLNWWVAKGLHQVVGLAVETGDLATAAEEIVAFHTDLRLDDLEDNQQRAEARLFVAICQTFLTAPGSIGHPRETEVDVAMRHVGDVLRATDTSTPALEAGRHEVMRLRAARAGTARTEESVWVPPRPLLPVARHGPRTGGQRRIAAAAATVAAARTGREPERLAQVLADMAELVSISTDTSTVGPAAAVLAHAALTVVEIHNDPHPLFAAADRLTATPGLAHLLRANAHAVTNDNSRATAEVALALSTQDSVALDLLPHLHALRGLLIVRSDPTALDAGIDACREGRAANRARTTVADLPLARLLVEKGLHQDTRVDVAVALLREAVDLCRRSGGEARDVAVEAKTALDVLTGRGDDAKRLQAWRTAVRSAERAPVMTRTRLATAWVRWALGTTRADLAAEAYHHLVTLIPAGVRARYHVEARDRVLAAAEEHIEEAGYWLALAGRYRDAAVALETGRAIVLSALAERDDPAVAEALKTAGRAELLDRYRAALAEVDARERRPDGGSHQAWAGARAVAREIGKIIDIDLMEPEVKYADVTAATDDGPLVYVAAAKASGYALIVAADQDPQCVWLSDFDRASVADLLLAHAGRSSLSVGRDLPRLWTKGIRDFLVPFARGRIVTLIPVGLLNLVPLHAVGYQPGKDSYPGFAGQYAPLRYAPNARTLRWCAARGRAFAGRPMRLLVADVPRGVDQPEKNTLKYATEETSVVAALWPGQCTRVSDATWHEFGQLADGYDVWHLACHGHADPAAILESRLVFADTRVTVADLRDRFRSTPRRLAVLSACDLNMTGSDLPNETISMPSALLRLGFTGVIAASWQAPDLATAYLMIRFYQVWRETGTHPAIALNIAQKWLREADTTGLAAIAPNLPLPTIGGKTRPFAHPLFWAAFAYTGG
jgi:CHAT domain-containing protein